MCRLLKTKCKHAAYDFLPIKVQCMCVSVQPPSTITPYILVATPITPDFYHGKLVSYNSKFPNSGVSLSITAIQQNWNHN